MAINPVKFSAPRNLFIRLSEPSELSAKIARNSLDFRRKQRIDVALDYTRCVKAMRVKPISIKTSTPTALKKEVERLNGDGGHSAKV